MGKRSISIEFETSIAQFSLYLHNGGLKPYLI